MAWMKAAFPAPKEVWTRKLSLLLIGQRSWENLCPASWTGMSAQAKVGCQVIRSANGAAAQSMRPPRLIWMSKSAPLRGVQSCTALLGGLSSPQALDSSKKSDTRGWKPGPRLGLLFVVDEQSAIDDGEEKSLLS